VDDDAELPQEAPPPIRKLPDDPESWSTLWSEESEGEGFRSRSFYRPAAPKVRDVPSKAPKEAEPAPPPADLKPFAQALRRLARQVGEVQSHVTERLELIQSRISNVERAGEAPAIPEDFIRLQGELMERLDQVERATSALSGIDPTKLRGEISRAASGLASRLVELETRVGEVRLPRMTELESALEGLQAQLAELAPTVEERSSAVLQELAERGTVLETQLQARLTELGDSLQERLTTVQADVVERLQTVVEEARSGATSAAEGTQAIAGRVQQLLAELAEVRQESDERITTLAETLQEQAGALAATQERTASMTEGTEHALAAALDERVQAVRAAVDEQVQGLRGDLEARLAETIEQFRTRLAVLDAIPDTNAALDEVQALEVRLARAVADAEARMTERAGALETATNEVRASSVVDSQRLTDLANRVEERVTRSEGALEHAIRDLRGQLEERTTGLERSAVERALELDARLSEISDQVGSSLTEGIAGVRRELTVRVDENTDSLESRLDTLEQRAESLAGALAEGTTSLRSALELHSEAVQTTLAGRLETIEGTLTQRVRELQTALEERERSETELGVRVGQISDALTEWIRDTEERFEARSGTIEHRLGLREEAERGLAERITELDRSTEARAHEARTALTERLDSLESTGDARAAEVDVRLSATTGELREELLNGMTAVRDEMRDTVDALRSTLTDELQGGLSDVRERLASSVAGLNTTASGLSEALDRVRREAELAVEEVRAAGDQASEAVRLDASQRSAVVESRLAHRMDDLEDTLTARVEAATGDLRDRLESAGRAIEETTSAAGEWRGRLEAVQAAIASRLETGEQALAERLAALERALPVIAGEVRDVVDVSGDRAATAAARQVDAAVAAVQGRLASLETGQQDLESMLRAAEADLRGRLETAGIRIEQEIQSQVADARIQLGEAIRQVQDATGNDRVSDIELRERLADAERGLADRFVAMGDRIAKQVRTSDAGVRRRLDLLAHALTDMEGQRRSMSDELDALIDAHGSVVKAVEVLQERAGGAAGRPRPRRKGEPDGPADDVVTPRLQRLERDLSARLSSLEKTVNTEIGESRQDVTRRLALLEERWAESLEERLAELIENESGGPRRRGRRPAEDPT
jgi:uncharacterized phage infection (PIP) family protein YhgE